jgi:hypothetical protein
MLPGHRRRQTDAEKLAYIKAVRCLHDKPAKYGKYFSGVRTRYDDFVSIHMVLRKVGQR